MAGRAAQVLAHPDVFALRTLKRFRANQGLLLAGAVAYYALPSIVPLLILSVITLSHFIEAEQLLSTLGRYLVAATLLLLGAQVIAEYERFGIDESGAAPRPFSTEAA